jgi:hypothetical protein
MAKEDRDPKVGEASEAARAAAEELHVGVDALARRIGHAFLYWGGWIRPSMWTRLPGSLIRNSLPSRPTSS